MGRLFAKRRRPERAKPAPVLSVDENITPEQAAAARGPRKKTARFNDAVEVVEFQAGPGAGLQIEKTKSVGLEEQIVPRTSYEPPPPPPSSPSTMTSIREIDEAIAQCRSAAKLQALLQRKAELEMAS